MPDIKKSYGIICINRTDKTKPLKILLIRKPVTYHFCKFITGKYDQKNDEHIIKLFNNMTYHEKMDILSMRFEYMWYRIYHSNPELLMATDTTHYNFGHYIKSKEKFQRTFCMDGGKRLRSLLANTKNADPLWEIPKGRKNPNENDLEAAIREFYEETGIKPSRYKLLLQIQPYIETYVDFGVIYQNIYYFAEITQDFEPQLRFTDTGITSEVSAIQWCGMNDIRNLVTAKETASRLIKTFEKIISKYRNIKSFSVKHLLQKTYNKRDVKQVSKEDYQPTSSSEPN